MPGDGWASWDRPYLRGSECSVVEYRQQKRPAQYKDHRKLLHDVTLLGISNVSNGTKEPKTVSEWQRWPAAQAYPHTLTVEVRDRVTHRVLETVQEPGLIVRRERDGGVPYPLAPHSACWRSLGEILEHQKPAPHRVRRFVRRYGPLTHAAFDAEPVGGMWVQTAGWFATLAKLWGPVDADGISQWNRPLDHTHGLIYVINAWLGDDHPPPIGTLLRFMLTQCLRHFAEHTPHRRCLACNSWIEATRTNRTHCDALCRKAGSRQRAAMED